MAKDKKQRPHLAQRIVDLRKSIGTGRQIEFAQLLKTDQGTLSKWETGVQRPSPEVLVRIASLAEGAAQLYFLEEAGLPPAYLLGEKMLPELEKASTAVVARSISKQPGKLAPIDQPAAAPDWDPELMVVIIETVNKKLREQGRKLPDKKYARLLTLLYDFSHGTGRPDSAIVEQFLKIA